MDRIFLGVVFGAVLSGSTFGQLGRGETQLDKLISPAGATRSADPCIAATGNHFHAVWTEGPSGKGESENIYYCRSTDGGKTWSDPVWIDGDDATADREPCVAADGSKVAIAWLRGGSLQDVVAVLSTDAGLSFGPEVDVSQGMTGDAGDADQLSVVCCGDCIAFLWEDDANDPGGNEHLWLVSSGDCGVTYGLPFPMNDTLPGVFDVDAPEICCTGYCLYVTWLDNRAGTDQVFFSRSIDCGLTWSLDAHLSTSLGFDADTPAICCDDQKVVVTWVDDRFGSDLVFTTISTNKGATFSVPIQAGGTPAGFDAKNPDCCVAGDKIYIGWNDDRNGDEDGYIYSTISCGATWAEDMLPKPVGGQDAFNLQLACAGDYIFATHLVDFVGPDRVYLAVSPKCGLPDSFENFLASPGILSGGDADAPGVAVDEHRNVTTIWIDDRSGPGNSANDVFVSGSRFPTLRLQRVGTSHQFVLEHAGASDNGKPFLAVFSGSGTISTALPGGTYMCLGIDYFTILMLKLPGFFLSNVANCGAETVPLHIPFPLHVVGLILDPFGNVCAATDPIFKP